ncbi:MAG: hypothetical protein Q9172_007199 [Xanthocarpia lactea]
MVAWVNNQQRLETHGIQAPHRMRTAKKKHRTRTHLLDNLGDNFLLLLIVGAHKTSQIDHINSVQIERLVHLDVSPVEDNLFGTVTESTAQCCRFCNSPRIAVDVVDDNRLSVIVE